MPEVDLVINYDIPMIKGPMGFLMGDRANYLHRVGRTGRFGTDGLAITLYKESDEDMKDQARVMDDIEDYYKMDVEKVADIKTLIEKIKAFRTENLENNL